jgi:hypothetical protein
MKKLFALLVCILCVAIGAHAQLFYDNFTRGSDPGPLTPWTAQSGTWTVTGGVFQSGPNAAPAYANATITNNFTNCTVQARVKFPAGAFGGGIAGRMNPATGARYSAWVYPENSPGGSNVLRLLKFQSYSGFGYLGVGNAPIQTVNLASVGTGFHNLRMDVQTNRITVFFDNVQMLTTNDVEAAYYTNGSAGLELWTDSTPYVFTADDVVVNNLGLLAGNDAFTTATGTAFNAPAPGVLANDTGGTAALNATLVAGATHGVLNLSSNGGFTYTATNGFAGTDTFTYRANDGVTSSGTTTVTLTVTADHAPVAVADFYAGQINSTLTVASPGVLANDTDVDGNALTANLVSSTTSGILIFNTNGGFSYTPNSGFVGSDSFTYRANDGLSNSAPATVSITVAPPSLFSDDFTRGTDPGPLTPWTAQSGTWTVTGGQLKGGTNNQFNYAFLTESNAWSDYTVQARVQFPVGAFGGGLGGRLNPVTGAHYAAWIYPENSVGGSNVLRLIKFQNYGGFAYNGTANAAIQQVNLAAVGTNFHTIKLAFFGARIAVYLDSIQMMSVTDTDTGASPYLSGAASLDFWTDQTGYTFTADDVIANVLVTDDNFIVSENTPLVVPAPGILVGDTAVFGTNLVAAVATPPAHGNVTLNTNGGFTYTPAANYSGSDSFTYSDSDAGTNIGTGTVNLSVIIVNTAPSLPVQTNRTIAELTALSVTNTATDADVPAQTLTYALLSPPTGATISTNGVISWMPTEAQGPGTYTLSTVVTDNGAPPASATNSFQVTVTEVNTAPVLPAQTDRTINELTLLSVANGATDTDLPANNLTYSLLAAPTGAVISSSGRITWTPTEAQGPSTNIFTTRVVDNGSPALSATNSFAVIVNEVNVAPVLPAQTNRTIAAQTLLTVTNTATDSDIPANTLSYLLLSPPLGATISTNGVITWIPTPSQSPTTNLIRTVVTDDGSPPISVTNTFSVFVNSNPVVVLDSTALILEGCTPTNNAIDPGETVVVAFTLRNTGTGPTTNLVITLLNSNGVAAASGPVNYGVLAQGASVTQPFTFSAVGSCGGSITANLKVQDGALNLGTFQTNYSLGTTATIVTQNFDTMTAPTLPAGWNTSSSGAQSNWVTETSTRDTLPNGAFCPDVPGIGSNIFVSAPMTLSGALGKLIFRNSYSLEGNTTTGYDGGVLEIKIGTNDFVDVLAAGCTFASGGYNRTLSSIFGNPLAGRQAWSSTSGGFITTTVNLPATANGQVVQFRWICGTDTDNNSGGGTGWTIDSIALTAVTCCANTAPMLADQADRAVNELTTLVVTNTATDSSTAASGLNYQLQDPPAGAVIDTNGIITWTPTEAQGPSTNIITTIVTDNAFPPLSATNSFQVTVLEMNAAPVLPVQTDQTIPELTQLMVTNTAADADLPANHLTYALLNAPNNAAIDANGVISWTPSEAQGPSTNVFVTVVTDDGAPAMSATNSFVVVVTEVNTPPVLSVIPDQSISGNALLSVTNAATDSDLPANALTYQLAIAPSGALIDAAGVITWTAGSSASTNIFQTIVTDNGIPPLSATNQFQAFVTAAENVPPPLIESIVVSNGDAVIRWTSVSNHAYRVQYEEDVTGNAWSNLVPDITATGTSSAVTNAVGEAQTRFYRVILLP